MKLVIKIPEETVKEIKDNAMFAKDIADNIKWDVTGEIVNGTPLPKGHGRLIDADRLKEVFRKNTGYDYHDLIDIAPTILEADKAESEV